MDTPNQEQTVITPAVDGLENEATTHIPDQGEIEQALDLGNRQVLGTQMRTETTLETDAPALNAGIKEPVEVETKPVLEVAEIFTALAAAPSTVYGIPEQLLAGYIGEQIRAGNENINLTQSYLTESPDAADARHTLALNNLLPQIEMAQKSGITFEAGEAQLASEKLQEIIAIRNTEAVEGNGLSIGG
jgi:hypothetical protein